jgi:hypothetical protein
MDRGPISQTQDFRTQAAWTGWAIRARGSFSRAIPASIRNPGLVARLKAGTGPIGGYMAPRTAGRAQQENGALFEIKLHANNDECQHERHGVCDHHRPIPDQDSDHEPKCYAHGKGEMHP